MTFLNRNKIILTQTEIKYSNKASKQFFFKALCEKLRDINNCIYLFGNIYNTLKKQATKLAQISNARNQIQSERHFSVSDESLAVLHVGKGCIGNDTLRVGHFHTIQN